MLATSPASRETGYLDSADARGDEEGLNRIAAALMYDELETRLGRIAGDLRAGGTSPRTVSYTHLTLPTNREV